MHRTYSITFVRQAAVLMFILLAALISVPSEASPEKLIVKIILNGEVKGDYLVHLDAGDDFLVRPEDLGAMGLNVPPGKAAVIEGQSYQSLRSLSGIAYSFDKKTLTLNITSAPSLLSKTRIDLSPPGNLTVYYPRENSAFFNYGLNYYHSDITGSHAVNLAGKLGVRSGDVLFLTDTMYTRTPEASQLVRLMSNVTYERRGELQWLVAGDAFASSGELGSTVNIGGLSFMKLYRLDPYFIKQPMFSVSGAASLPSEASVYLDGMLIRKQKLSPGEFDLNDLNYYGGSHLVEIVLKDAFGNEQRVVHPFYFTDALLKKGLHEYSYHAGFLRQQYGVESNDYGDAAFSAFHRYGVNDSLTLGGRAEATRGLYSIGPQATFLIPRAGVVSLSLAASRNVNDETGYAGSFNHTYQYGSVATRLLYKKYSGNYVTIQSALLTVRPKSETGAGVSFSLSAHSAASVDYTAADTSDGNSRKTAAATWSMTLAENLSGYVTARRTEDRLAGASYECLAGINYTFGKNTYASSLNRVSEGARDNIVQVSKNITTGEGLSYRAAYEAQESDSLRNSIVSPFVQYNGRYGVYSADYSYQRANGQPSETYSLSASGAAVYAGGAFGLTRPVNDSFTIVKVDGVKDVKVSLANMEMGRTNASGTVIIPEISSYNYNQVSLDPSNVPMDYQLSDVSVYVSPSQWSGSCIVVSAKKMQAFTGRIVVRKDGKTEPVEMQELTMKIGKAVKPFLTGKNGEFYFENTITSGKKEKQQAFRGCQALSDRGALPETVITPGTYETTFVYEGQACTVDLQIVKSEDVIVDLGDAIGRCGRETPTPESRPKALPVPEASKPAAVPAVGMASERESEHNPPYSIVVKLPLVEAGRSLSQRDGKAVAAVALFLKKHPEYLVRIEGHGDRHGSDEAAFLLGMKTADTIKKQLLRAGVRAGRIMKVESFGRKKMLCDAQTTACDRMNRRCVVRLVRDGAANEAKKEPG